jgi:N-acetylneuraminic acid mutarotase
MQMHKEQQQGRVELNIGGQRFQTSIQTLRRLPHTFFDAYFSGRYAQDVCLDGSIFVDRDGEHFGHVLEYMRDGVVSVAQAGAQPSVSLLRALKREFGYYCIELVAEQPVEPAQEETAYVMGRIDHVSGARLSSMERYDTSSGQWSVVAAMGIRREQFSACVIAGEIYVTGGENGDGQLLSCVEKYSPSSDMWSAVAPMPAGRCCHVAVAVGSAMYVLGGWSQVEGTAQDVFKFDSTQGTWSEVASAPQDFVNSAAVAVNTDIYVFGGEDPYGEEHDFVYKYDTVTDAWSWSILANLPYANSSHSASICNGLVYIVGAGEEGDEVLRFDPASAEWSTLDPTLHGRRGGQSFVLGGCLYSVGGPGSSGPSVERYDATTDTWTAVTDMLQVHRNVGAVTIGSTGPAEEQDLFDSLIAKAFRRQP